MKVLIAFEKSQIIMSEFLKRGHDAWSCDIQECSGDHPERHLQMTFEEAVKLKDWDFCGIHPVCTKLTCSGNRHYAVGKPKHQERIEAINNTYDIWTLLKQHAKSGYMENPKGVLNSDERYPIPQIVQPWYFGDPVPKTTCLWLHNLPYLIATIYIEPEYLIYNLKKNKSGKSRHSIFGKLSTGRNNEKNRELRSQSFPGMAKAMAEQWS